uniref:Uncharacterized protein n=1 Tax=Halimeda micronesica TaxID=170426 RepID=A0A386AXE6_9CHLO|nr:hypothetical protein [Halimeda micronesica]
MYRFYLLNLIFEAIDAYFRGFNVNYQKLSELISKTNATLQKLNKNFFEITQIQPKSVKSGKSFEALLKFQIPKNIWEILPKTKTGLIKFSFKEFGKAKKSFAKKNTICQRRALC